MKFICFLAMLVAGTSSIAKAQIDWKDVIRCDRGALKIEVDPMERRRVTVAIMDPNIVRYLSGYPRAVDGQNGLFTPYGPNRLTTLIATTTAWIDRGIFAQTDFQGLSISTKSSTEGAVPGARLTVVGTGMKLDIVDSEGQSVRNWIFRTCEWNPYGN